MGRQLYKGKALIQWAFALAFVVSFILTAWLLANDMTASATVAAVLTLSMGLFCFLPILESFTAFGLSAQFRKRLDEANDLLALLREQAALNGRIQVGMIANANRFTTGGYEQRMQQVDLVSSSLQKVGVSKEEIDDIREPYIRNICFDVARVYLRKIGTVAQQAITDLSVPMNKARHEGDEAALAELQQRIVRLQDDPGENLHTLDADQIVALMELERSALETRDTRDFSEETKRSLEVLRMEALSVIRDARQNGNITPAGNRFLIHHRGA